MLEGKVPLGESRAGDVTGPQVGSRESRRWRRPAYYGGPPRLAWNSNLANPGRVQAGNGSEFLLLWAPKPELRCLLSLLLLGSKVASLLLDWDASSLCHWLSSCLWSLSGTLCDITVSLDLFWDSFLTACVWRVFPRLQNQQPACLSADSIPRLHGLSPCTPSLLSPLELGLHFPSSSAWYFAQQSATDHKTRSSNPLSPLGLLLGGSRKRWLCYSWAL